MKRFVFFLFLLGVTIIVLLSFFTACNDDHANSTGIIYEGICVRDDAGYLGNTGMMATIGGKQCTATIAEAGNGPDFFLFYWAGLIDTNYFEIIIQVDKTVGGHELGGPDNAGANLNISHGLYAYYYTFEDEATGCLKITEISGEEQVKGAFFFTAGSGTDTIEVCNGSFNVPIVD